MINSSQYKRAWQSRVGDRAIHLNINCFEKKEVEYLTNQYHLVVNNVDVNDKTIIDYGCGGGLFGHFLYSWEYTPEKYIGIDIADRATTEAKLNNICWEEKETIIDIIKIDPIELIDFSRFKADIFIMLNVVRFLPNIEYIKLLFNKINKSKIKEVILNFKISSADRFRDHPYKTTHDIGKANRLTMKTVLELLNKYKPNKIKNQGKNDCFVFFKKNRRKYTKRKEKI